VFGGVKGRQEKCGCPFIQYRKGTLPSGNTLNLDQKREREDGNAVPEDFNDFICAGIYHLLWRSQ